MYLNKWPLEDIWNLKFDIEKYNVLYIKFKNIKVEYKLSNKEIKK